MQRILECIPNFSEGRDKSKIDQIVSEIKSADVEILDVEMNADHNRAVVTFVGEPDIVLEAAFRGVKKAAELIDLTTHKGEHPRIGATDVVPFVPISNITTEECAQLAKQLAQRIAEKLEIPVYLYEDAATRPERKNLANIRKGEFEGLSKEIETNPDCYPDFGKPRLHPTAGATVVGARFPLIAYNVNLNTPDVAIAKKIARAIRFRDGGLRYVKALGFELKEEGLAQVSCNMTNYPKTPLYRVFEMVKNEAQRYGVVVKESEIVGLVPEKALIDTAAYFLQLNRFKEDQILEYHLRGKAGPESMLDFLMALSSPSPTPGGGSVAALQGALGTSLLAMVADITTKKTDDAELKDYVGTLNLQMHEFYNFIKKDKDAFDKVMAAYKLPKETEDEKQCRKLAIQHALKNAAEVPLEVARRITKIYPLAKTLATKGRKSAISDVGVAIYSLHSGFLSARVNVLINLASITDQGFNETIKTELDSLKNKEENLYKTSENLFLTSL